jgi:hypothetical protein
MSNKAKREYLLEIRNRYFSSSKTQKKIILDEFCKNCSYNRKYAIRLINDTSHPKSTCKGRGRKKIYHRKPIIDFLKHILVATNFICSKRLVVAIKDWLPFYLIHFPNSLSDEHQELLLKISHSTIDRLLKKFRKKSRKLGLSSTKPGSLLKKHIPIRTNQWDESIPGFLEADSVAHCGSSVAGQYCHSIQAIDISTQWTECRATWGKGEHGVFDALRSIEGVLPFKILGFDSDNGNEFLNRNLLKYFLNKKPPVCFTRSREYQKNDNAHIEQKNWTNIRQYLGYHRFDNPKILPLLNKLYSNEWSLFFNFFIPSVKLISKTRVGSKIVKVHDSPKTPFQRLLNSNYLKPTQKKKLIAKRDSLDPFLLQQSIKNQILNILKLVN